MTSRSPLLELTRVRILEFVRDPAALFWVFGFPILLAIALGLAFRNQPVQKPALAVVAPAGSKLAAMLSGSERLDVEVMTGEAALRALRRSNVDLLVRIDAEGSVVYHYDVDRPESRLARLAADGEVQRAGGRSDPVATDDEAVTTPGTRYVDFLLPGLIGLNLMGSGMWGIGYAVVDSRKRKLLKRFAATPMHRSHFLLSFIFSRLVFLAAEVGALLLAGYLMFDVQTHGSLAGVIAISLLGALCFSGMALLLAARPTSTEAGAGWMNAVQLPMWMLCGAFFSYERFPEWMHEPIRALPLTALNDSLRSVMNDGQTVWASWPEFLVLAGWGAGSFLLALKVFRWQ